MKTPEMWTPQQSGHVLKVSTLGVSTVYMGESWVEIEEGGEGGVVTGT